MCQDKYVICPDINKQVNPGSKIWPPNVRSILKPYCEHWKNTNFYVLVKLLKSNKLHSFEDPQLKHIGPIQKQLADIMLSNKEN